MYNDLIIIIKCKEKSKLSIRAMERKFGIPMNVLQNVRYGHRTIPKIYKEKMLTFLTTDEKPPIDKWDNISAKKAMKYRFPKFFKEAMEYCKEKNIKVADLIKLHKRMNP